MRNDGYDLGAILNDLKAGETYRDIGRRHRVSRQLVSKLAVKHDLRRRNKYLVRPVFLCACGTKTTAMTGVCVLCRSTSEYPPPSPADGIDPNGWAFDPRRRIQVWHDPEQEAS